MTIRQQAHSLMNDRNWAGLKAMAPEIVRSKDACAAINLSLAWMAAAQSTDDIRRAYEYLHYLDDEVYAAEGLLPLREYNAIRALLYLGLADAAKTRGLEALSVAGVAWLPLLHHMTGAACEALADYEGAVDHVGAAATSDVPPEQAALHICSMISLLTDAGRLDDARAWIGRAAQLDAAPRMLFPAIAKWLLQKGRFRAALAVGSKAAGVLMIETTTFSYARWELGETQLVRAEAALSLGRFDQAARYAQSVFLTLLVIPRSDYTDRANMVLTKCAQGGAVA